MTILGVCDDYRYPDTRERQSAVMPYLHEELIGKVLLVQVAGHERLDALAVLLCHPEESGPSWSKTPLVKVPSVEVGTQGLQVQVKLKFS